MTISPVRQCQLTAGYSSASSKRGTGNAQAELVMMARHMPQREMEGVGAGCREGARAKGKSPPLWGRHTVFFRGKGDTARKERGTKVMCLM